MAEITLNHNKTVIGESGTVLSEKNGRLIINIILERNAKVKEGDLEKFEDIKNLLGISKPNTEILRECIRTTHKLLFG